MKLVGADVGGTFTGVVLADPAEGVVRGVAEICAPARRSWTTSRRRGRRTCGTASVSTGVGARHPVLVVGPNPYESLEATAGA